MAKTNKNVSLSVAPYLLEKIGKFFERAGTPYDYIYQESQRGKQHTTGRGASRDADKK